MNTQPLSRFFIAAAVAALAGTGIGICYSLNTTMIEAARITLRGPQIEMKVVVDDDHGVICWMTNTGGVFCMPLSWMAKQPAPATAPAVPRDQARDL